jgi:lipopolysaccharide transport system ATP-binding protein
MMSEIAIRVEGLSKRYVIGARQERYQTMRDTLVSMASAPVRGARRVLGREMAQPSASEIWALKDVSFEVKRGEVVGIIGRNGAGKSTLLKILSRITEPTQGSAAIYGRVGSLLEVGTGFHPELTGRENIFLNGAILGMKRHEIQRRFDEIVAFAEVEQFIDTPVKHYSSGMYLRLAFAVAAHLEPEILVVDEVLAVGDAQFQKKCLGKMGEVAGEGRTVLFVSHNMAAVRELCRTAMLIDAGRVAFAGAVDYGIQAYLGALFHEINAASDRNIQFQRILVRSGEAASVATGEPFAIELEIECAQALHDPLVICIIEDSRGNMIVHEMKRGFQLGLDELGAGQHILRLGFPVLWLAPGIYSLFFKILGDTHSQPKARFVSDHLPLTVTGKEDETFRAICMPDVVWRVE